VAVVKSALEGIFTNVDFRIHDKLDVSIIKESALFPLKEDKKIMLKGGNYLSASYNNRHFEQSDIEILEEGIENFYSIFCGRLMVFNYDAISNEPVFVSDKRVKFAQFGESEAVQTELGIFNQKFNAYAKDAVSAFRILTPQVIEGILLAAENLKFPVALSFINNRMYFFIKSDESFVMTAMDDTTFADHLEKIKKEIQVKIDVVERLYLRS